MHGHLDNNLIRPAVNIEDMVNKILWVYQNKKDADEMVEKAYKWAMENLDWKKNAKQFDDLITKSIS